MTQAIERIAGALCLLAVGGSAIYIAKDLHETQTQIQATVSSLNITIQKVNNSYDSQAESTQKIERDIRVEMWHLDRTLGSVDTTLASIPPVASALTETAHSASGALGEAQTTIKGLQPLESAATVDLEHLTPIEDESRQSLASFNALLSRPSLAETIDGVGATAENAKLISGDLYYWSHPIFHPDPCTTAKCRWGRGLSIAGNYLGIGANGGKVYQIFQPTPVKLVH